MSELKMIPAMDWLISIVPVAMTGYDNQSEINIIDFNLIWSFSPLL